MFTAQKGNKVLKIESAEVKQYRALGFDIYEGDKLLHHGHGKTVPYAKYEALESELEATRFKLALAEGLLAELQEQLEEAKKAKASSKKK
jgi:hypothetical protein